MRRGGGQRGETIDGKGKKEKIKEVIKGGGNQEEKITEE